MGQVLDLRSHYKSLKAQIRDLPHMGDAFSEDNSSQNKEKIRHGRSGFKGGSVEETCV